MLFLITAQQHETRDKMQYAYCYVTVMASSRCAPELHYIQACYYTRLYRIYWKGILLRHHTPARMAYLHSLTNSGYTYDSYEIHHLSNVKNYRYATNLPFWFRANVCWFTFLSFFPICLQCHLQNKGEYYSELLVLNISTINYFRIVSNLIPHKVQRTFLWSEI